MKIICVNENSVYCSDSTIFFIDIDALNVNNPQEHIYLQAIKKALKTSNKTGEMNADDTISCGNTQVKSVKFPCKVQGCVVIFYDC